ncbi:aminotransferase class V-fold PLP-dependent enzyme [Nocardia asiatica]|uniref:aminotransferase class V-fold PLP-dependent enzyme n=1 Tax=Nocardia asiatica TaxID=209252 RepID=UPI0035711FC5
MGREIGGRGSGGRCGSGGRHEAGSLKVLGAAALAAACDALCAIDAETLAAHEHRLADRLRDGLAAIPGVQLLRIWTDSPDAWRRLDIAQRWRSREREPSFGATR